MEIWHRVGLYGDSLVNDLINDLAIKHKRLPIPGGNSSAVTFDMNESDARWSKVFGFLQERGGSDIYDTRFEEHEILNSRWIRLIPSFQTGYPEPKASWIQNPTNYNTFCHECGIGYVQIAPFRLAKEPLIGKNDFMSPNWTYAVFDARRVTKRIQTENMRGLKFEDVLIGAAQTISSIVEQLVVTRTSEPSLIPGDLEREFCPSCGLTKYASHRRGWMQLRRDGLPIDVDCFQTDEWFGSGGYGGYRELIISNRFARLIIDEKWRGVTLKPVELVGN